MGTTPLVRRAFGSFAITASRDGGKTFSPFQMVGTPVDRPWLKVDQTTGTVLKSAMKGGVTTCTPQAPCLFFETSRDEGQHWTRQHVPLPPGGLDTFMPVLAADPGRAGRFAISCLSGGGRNLNVVVTDDFGDTWRGPFMIPESAADANFKNWMDYGPTGVLGLVWRKQRTDLVAPPLPPVRVNGETSPPDPALQDDLSYVALDDRNAQRVWGDRRRLAKMQRADASYGGIQAFYGRVPFSTAAGSTKCGR